jgi:hypothetical protein
MMGSITWLYSHGLIIAISASTTALLIPTEAQSTATGLSSMTATSYEVQHERNHNNANGVHALALL